MAHARQQLAGTPGPDRVGESEAGHSARDTLLARLMRCIGHDLGNLVFLVKARRDLLSDATKRGISENPDSLRIHYDSLHRTLMGLWWVVQDPLSDRLGARDTDLAAWWPVALPVLRCAVPRGTTLEGGMDGGLPRLGVQPHALIQAVADALCWTCDAGPAPLGVVISAATSPEGTRVALTVRAEPRRDDTSPPSQSLPPGHPPAPEVATLVVRRAGGSIDVWEEHGRARGVTVHIPIATGEEGTEGVRPARVASVSLSSEEMRSAACEALRGVGFEVRTGPEPDDATRVWVVDAPDASPGQLQRFMAAGGGRWAVVLGRAGLEHDRIVEVADPGDASLLAVALRDVAETLERRSKPI